MLNRLFLVLLIIFPTFVIASELRFNVETTQTSTTTGDPGISIKAKLQISDTDSNPSIGEQAEFRISNPRDGDLCANQGGIGQTDENGYIYATCKATQLGELKVYAFSISQEDRSTETTLIFTNQPAVTPITTVIPTDVPSSSTNTPTPTITSKPVALPTKKQAMTNTQTGGFIGNGLVEEKDSPNQDGLSSGQTLGTATQDINSSGDKDLLSTLIFLTGAVVLVVWTVYAVLVQKGVIKTVKKKEHSGGITPQPLE